MVVKKILFTLCCIWGTLAAQPSYTPEVAKPLSYLYQIDEFRQLMAEVENEGAISIRTADFGMKISGAMWVSNKRAIYLNSASHLSLGNMIRSILFELHNAKTEKWFLYYDKMACEGRISKNEYIETIERLEYENVVRTVYILNKGIRMGLLPREAHWEVARTFQEHLHMQRHCGHSGLIGQTFDLIVKNSRNTAMS